jgi:hypothetical protein
LAESRRLIALLIKGSPDAYAALLQSLKDSFGESPAPIPTVEPMYALADITASELLPLVAIRAQNETEAATKGVRTYKGATSSNVKDSVPKAPEPTERQLLARRAQAIMRNADKGKSSAGQARKARTEEGEAGKATGNSGNAAAAAQTRANEVCRP